MEPGGYRLQASVNVSVGRVCDDLTGSERRLDAACWTRRASAEAADRSSSPASLVDDLTPTRCAALSVLAEARRDAVSLDDFGTGPAGVELLAGIADSARSSSIAALTWPPFPAMPAACALLRTYATSARALGLRCVAEGVETAQQHLFLVAAESSSPRATTTNDPCRPPASMS